MFQLVFYVPESHLDVVKQAVFDVGGGRYESYDCCCWQSEGVGQFRPLKGSQPFLGQVGELESVVEFKVELICEDKVLSGVVEALVEAHPYEEPAFSFWQINV